METLISFIAGIVIAAITAVIIYRSKIRQVETDTENRLFAEFNAERAKLEAELQYTKARADSLQEAAAQAKVDSVNAVEAVKEDLRKQHQEDIDLREKNHSQAFAALQERFDETLAKVTAQMKAETGDMLKERQKEFAESSNKSIGQILDPLRENIEKLKETMAKGSIDQAKREGEMAEQIRALMAHSDAARKSADELAAAFKHGNKVQGDWGEMKLEELLESQGLIPGIHFDVQPTMKDADGKVLKNSDGNMLRPDLILHLDQRREVIIDSKVSMKAYVDYVNAENEVDRRRFLKEHIDSLKQHVRELSDKHYSDYIKAPKVSAGYVIMFVPNIGALWSALKAEPDLWRNAADKNVYIADEQSLYGALKIVKMTWTQIAQVANHEKVFELADEMIERVGMFLENYKKVGSSLKAAVDAYESSSKKLTEGQSVMKTAGKLVSMGAKNNGKHAIPDDYLDVDDIPALPEVDEKQNK